VYCDLLGYAGAYHSEYNLPNPHLLPTNQPQIIPSKSSPFKNSPLHEHSPTLESILPPSHINKQITILPKPHPLPLTHYRRTTQAHSHTHHHPKTNPATLHLTSPTKTNYKATLLLPSWYDDHIEPNLPSSKRGASIVLLLRVNKREVKF